MKSYSRFTIVFFLILFPLIGSSKDIFIENIIIWKEVQKYNLNNSEVSYFKPESGRWDLESSLPTVINHWKVKGNEATFLLNNIETRSLSSKELACLEGAEYPTEFKFSLNVKSSRFVNNAVIEVNGVRKNKQSGDFEKLVRYSGTISTSEKIVVTQKSHIANSVLSSGNGDWYKIGVTEDGVYKIDYDFLIKIGIDVNSLNPKHINIYGNSSGMLPENNNDFRFEDLAKNSIFIGGEEDGVFNQNDFILFYAKGPNTWKQQGGVFTHKVHQYCDSSYYFININSNILEPKRILPVNLSNSIATHIVTNFNDFQYIEEEKQNLAKSGREWFGDTYDVQTTFNYDFNFPNLIPSDSITIRCNTLISSTSTSPFFTINIDNNSKELPTLYSASGNGTYSPLAKQQTKVIKLYSSQDEFSIGVTFNKSGTPSSTGYLDYLEVNTIRELSMEENMMEFRDLSSVGLGNIASFEIEKQSNIKYLWETTDPRNIGVVPFIRTGSKAIFAVNTDSLRSFIAISGRNYLTPLSFGQVTPQNLHGLSHAEMIIITAPEFLTASNDLAAFHQSEGLSVLVVTTNQIYNEFSSGMRDATAIKSFLRMFYKRAGNNPNLLPKYCLLMGDGTYDNRNKLKHNKHFIPTYQSYESLAVTRTYTSDDYFAILADNAGMNNGDLLDIAIGRLPAKTLQEAKDMVNKIKIYSDVNSTIAIQEECKNGSNNSILKDWRNLSVYISDDGDNNAYFNDIENMTNKTELLHPEINISKIHADAYVESSTAGGDRNYGAENAFREQVEKGALVVNYIGHGGEVGLGHERYLNVPTIKAWTNLLNMPIFMTATCEFSRFDDHDRISAGEYVVLNSSGGAIGSFTTTRLVYSTSNAALNNYFYDTVFDKVNNERPRLGDIYQGTKNKYALQSGDVNYRKFALLGDPAVKLAIPINNVLTDSINGKSINVTSDTLTALSKVEIKGHIENNLGQVMSGFNGVLSVKIFDKRANLKTLANSPDSYQANFTTWKNLIYKGKATVKNGFFIVSFIIPKDISYQYGNGRISYYAENGIIDAKGYSEQLIIGGINLNANEDEEPPSVSLFMNNEKFVSGGMTDESPSLFAKIFDENGINTVGNGIGHDIEAILDNNTSNSIVLNDYYESDLDTYKSGTLIYPFEDLEGGPHTLSLKVWDVYNNSKREEIEFVVALNEQLALDHVLNYPNPFTTKTKFSFEHNQVCDYLDVQIQIFTISGKLVKTIKKRAHSVGYRIDGIAWDGRDDYGDNIGKGVYVYKVKVINEKGDSEEKYEKLVILK